MERCPDCPCTHEQIVSAGGCPCRPGEPPEFVRPPEGWYWTMLEEDQKHPANLQEMLMRPASQKTVWIVMSIMGTLTVAGWLYRLLK